ncbi:glycosyltransferase [Microvirgula aerodenitrificans]|uniref:glycosyltransferase n=1 Tax=Microvirgula aerodenitrificans TaxID=57480 RepID=UPI0028EA9921|nr:glycosyltransferase [Microvirgula aerodenitrificans]
MKILELDFERGWRGGERQTLLSSLAFRDAGHEVDLLCRDGEALATRAGAEGLTVHGCQRPLDIVRFLIRHGRNYDILHAQTGHALTWLAATRWAHRRPIVMSRRVAFALHGTFTTWKYRQADAVVAISQACADSVRRLGIADIHIIPSAVLPIVPDPERVRDCAAAWRLDGRKVVATTAALAEDKDPFTLIAAAAELLGRRDDVVFLHLGHGALLDAARARVAGLGLQDRYLLPGYQPQVEALFPLFDVFVMSSREEGLGSSVLDAFQARVPVASTDAGGLKELLAEGRGLLSPVGDSHALATHIDTLLAAGPGTAAMVDAACRYVRANHDVGIMAGRYLTLFQTLVTSLHS